MCVYVRARTVNKELRELCGRGKLCGAVEVFETLFCVESHSVS